MSETPKLRGSECPGFFCVDDDVPWETIAALRMACEARGVQFRPLDAASVQNWALAPLPPGSLLYTPATTARASAIEERIWGTGVATVYRGDLGPLRQVTASSAAFIHAGLNVPTAVPSNTTARAHVDAAVEALGGFPIVLRFPGFSVGRGIVRVDSRAGLYSALDFAQAGGRRPEIVQWIGDAEAWRVAVVGGKAVGAARGATPDGDFRAITSPNAEDYFVEVDAELARVAVAAADAVEVDAAGVDILRTLDGTDYVLEANTPFYFGHMQTRGIDVAGALVDMLLERAWAETRA